MNQPPYILTDVMAEVALSVKALLSLSVLNYQFGYVTELNQKLLVMAQTQQYANLKFPLFWFAQPFTIEHEGNAGWYGKLNNGRIYLIVPTEKTFTAQKRMELKFKPTLYPLYDTTLLALHRHKAFDTQSKETIKHKMTDRYWWGASQQAVISDVVDCIEISDLELKINNNKNTCIL